LLHYFVILSERRESKDLRFLGMTGISTKWVPS